MPAIPDELNNYISGAVEELESLYRQMHAKRDPEPWVDRQNLVTRLNALLLRGYEKLIRIKKLDPAFDVGFGQHCLLYLRDVARPLLEGLVPSAETRGKTESSGLPSQLFVWTGKCGLPMAFINAKTQDQSRRKLNDLAARFGQTLPDMRPITMADLADAVLLFDARVCTSGTLPVELYPRETE